MWEKDYQRNRRISKLKNKNEWVKNNLGTTRNDGCKAQCNRIKNSQKYWQSHQNSPGIRKNDFRVRRSNIVTDVDREGLGEQIKWSKENFKVW